MTSLLASICACFCLSYHVLAWNAEGHMVMAQMAYNHLDPSAKVWYDALIAVPLTYGGDSTSNFVTAAVWADDYKNQLGSGTWHYIDLPFSLDGTPTNGFVPAAFDVVKAINLSISTLTNRNSTQTDQATYLRYLLHFTGDIQQPLHTSDAFYASQPNGDAGGNGFGVSGWGNLHSLWDGGGGYLYDSLSRPLDYYSQITLNNKVAAIEADYPYTANSGTIPNPMDWALEGLAIAETNAYVGITLNSSPSSDYLNKVELTTEQRMAMGGHRLADLLNTIYAIKFATNPPTILSQPASQPDIQAGTIVTFGVTVIGALPLSYQWLKDDTALADGGNISGANTDTLVLGSVYKSDQGGYSVVVSNTRGSVTSLVATLTVMDPFITSQPVSQTKSVGETATFSVTAGGTAPLGYQWFRHGEPIAGATESTYTTNNVQLADSGSVFSCLVSNSYGTALSSNATLTVLLLPTDYFTTLFGAGTTNPPFQTSITNLAFHSYRFTPNGGLNAYQVCSERVTDFFTDPAGGTQLSLSDDSYAELVLSGGKTVAIYGTRTNRLYVGSNGYLTLGSGDTSYSPNYTTHFALPRVSVLFRDLNPRYSGTISWKQIPDRVVVTYQNVPIYGSSSQVNSFQVEMYFDGRVRITYLNLNATDGLVGLSAGTGVPVNFVDSDFSSYATCPAQPPMIAAQPASQTVAVGDAATFSVRADGSAPLGYAWMRNGVPIAGVTAYSYTTNNVQLADSGSLFSCLVSNAYGTALSSNAVLTVMAYPPTIVSQPANQTVNYGATASFSVTASGTAPLGYQWFRNGVAVTDGGTITGAATAFLTLGNVLQSNAGSYSVVVTNPAGSVTSQVATLTVLDPFIISQPVSRYADPGDTVTFSVSAAGTAPLGYQWRKDGAAGAWASASSMTLTNVQVADAGAYDVVVSNSSGSVTSLVARLTVGLSTGGIDPIQLTPGSYTYDIVVESSAPAALPFCLDATQGGGTSMGDYTWYEQGFYRSPYQATGVPQHGQTFQHQSNPNIQFTMPPDYTTNNCLLIDSTVTSGALTLIPATIATNFALLGSCASLAGGSGIVTYAVTHADARYGNRKSRLRKLARRGKPCLDRQRLGERKWDLWLCE